MAADLPTKTCATCGRSFAWRKRWERSWPDVRYCSNACKGGVSKIDRELEASILELLDHRKHGATICPSEAARSVVARSDAFPGEPENEDAWRSLMEPARRAARRLVASGQVTITQKGVVVDPSTAKGPIRIRKVTGL